MKSMLMLLTILNQMVLLSYIKYDEEEQKIHFAICDLGLGIPTTLRGAIPDIGDDANALRKSLDIGVSAKSNKHNMGFGLDNVLSNLKRRNDKNCE